jgi:hypothetical protein
MAKRKPVSSSSPSASKSTGSQPTLGISEQEQWRLIQQSGVLKQASDVYKIRPEADPLHAPVPASAGANAEDDDEGVNPLFEEIFQTIVIAMPLSFFLLLLHMYAALACAPRRRCLTPRLPALCTYSTSKSRTTGTSRTGWPLAPLVRRCCVFDPR